MEEELGPFIVRHNLTVNRQFIDNEPFLEQRYGSKVPVLTFNNVILCEYFLDPDKLLKIISQA